LCSNFFTKSFEDGFKKGALYVPLLLTLFVTVNGAKSLLAGWLIFN